MPKKLTEARKQFILGKLNEFYEDGITRRDEGVSDRIKARNVWNGIYSGNPPADSLFFPKIFALLRHHVRVIRKVYARPEHIIQVHPEGRFASDWEVFIAQKQREELLYQLNRMNDLKSFIDDTATQGEIIGTMIGKIRWIRETEVRFEDQTQLEFSEDGEVVETIQNVPVGQDITLNYPMIEWVDRETLLWEGKRQNWNDVKWVMQIDQEYTEDDLYELADQGYLDEDLVDEFLADQKRNMKSQGKRPQETATYKVAEFWGWMQTEDDEETEFIKVCAHQDFGYLLSVPDNEDIYHHLTGKPMIPYEVYHLVRKEGEIEGESLCLKARHLQAELNCIRNQRRRSIENDLNERFILDRNKDVQFTKLADSAYGTMIEANGLDGVQEIQHRDNTASSYGELQFVDQDLQELLGVNPLVLGMPDPHLADTAFGINLMSNNANSNIFDIVESYNTFFENIMNKVLELSIQYTPVEELEEAGMSMESIDRDDMRKPLRIRVDTGMGATSELVEINNKTKAFFMIQQLEEGLTQQGVEIGPMRYMKVELLRDILPLLGVKNMDRYIPRPEELEQFTKRMLDVKMDMMRRQQGLAVKGMEMQANNAFRQGQTDAAAQAQPAQTGGG